MTKIHIFPGQGSQFKGMGAELFSRYRGLVAEADRVLGYSIEALCLRDPHAQLNRTQFTQPALYVVSTLTHLARRARGDGDADFLAGHSLGEFSALFAAGAFDFATGLQLVKHRGELMGQTKGGAMAAVLGLPVDDIRRLLEQAGLDNLVVANYNSAMQTILSGAESDIDAIATAIEARGARYVRLNVSAAFHSSFMTDAQRKFAAHLQKVTLAPLRIPVISNVTALPYPRVGYGPLIEQQLTHPVRWHESISSLCSLPDAQFEEIGPGKVLTKIVLDVRKQPADVPAIAERFSMESLVDRLGSAPDWPATVAASTATDAAAIVGTAVLMSAAIPEITAASAKPTAAGGGVALPTPRAVFLFGGLGTQHHRMGEALYHDNLAYRACFDECNSIARPLIGADLVRLVYGTPHRCRPFDRLLHSHAALFSVQLSAFRAARDQGFEAEALVGWGTGEYVAAVAGGALTLKDGLTLVAAQSRWIEERTPEAATLRVACTPEWHARHAALFAGCDLTAIHHASSIAVTGPRSAVEAASLQLRLMQIPARMLPLRHGLQSPLAEPLRDRFIAMAKRLVIHSVSARLVSGSGTAPSQTLTADGLWNALRAPVDWPRSLQQLEDCCALEWIDLSPDGSLCGWTGLALGGQVNVRALLNRQQCEGALHESAWRHALVAH